MVSIGGLSKLVHVVHGASSGAFSLAGCTVSSVRSVLLDAFNLGGCKVAFVNGVNVPASYRLIGGDTLEFSAGWGRKGSDQEESLDANGEKIYKQHPYGKVWSKFDNETFQELKRDIKQHGLKTPIVTYQGKILDGWHRYQACKQVGVVPKFEEFQGGDLQAAELVYSSGIRRILTASQRYEAFMDLMEISPDFKESIDRLHREGKQRKVEGKALSETGQRIDVIGTKAKLAGVSRSTAAATERKRKEASATKQTGGVLKKPKTKNGTKKSEAKKSEEKKKSVLQNSDQSNEEMPSAPTKETHDCLSALKKVCDHLDGIHRILESVRRREIKITNRAEWETKLADIGQVAKDFQDAFKAE